MWSWISNILEEGAPAFQNRFHLNALEVIHRYSWLQDAGHPAALEHCDDRACDSMMSERPGLREFAAQPVATLLTQHRVVDDGWIMSIDSKDHHTEYGTIKEVMTKLPRGVGAHSDSANDGHHHDHYQGRFNPGDQGAMTMTCLGAPKSSRMEGHDRLLDDCSIMSIDSKDHLSRRGVLKDVVPKLPQGIGIPTDKQAKCKQCQLHYEEQGQSHEMSSRDHRHLANILDQEVFRHFWPLLDESRDYARLNGCRFHSRSFAGVGHGADEICPETGELSRGADSSIDGETQALADAKRRAAPMIYQFAERIRKSDPLLLEEFSKAFRIVMAESVRNAMIGTCQLLQLWPPSPQLVDILADDCAFEDVTASIPVIAQRLYNDERRRLRLAPCSGDLDPLRRRAMMASFIVEFAVAAGAPLPEPPETFDSMLKEFNLQASEWEQRESPHHQRKQLRI